MAPTFGTSGLRGLASDLTDEVVRRHVAAFLAVCPHGGRVFVGRDLRPSSPAIAAAAIGAIRAAGLEAVECGTLPTPALAQAAMTAGAAAVMVTGSHIPADRNGLKFHTPAGEITKTDEARILAAHAAGAAPPAAKGGLCRHDATGPYADRLVDAFGSRALAGLEIGVYRHASVARDLLEEVLTRLGAKVRPLGQSEVFMPLDTEAVDEATRKRLAGWCADHGLDAVVSTDGDGDRPLVADAAGRIVPGEVLGVLTAQALGARIVVVPVTASDMVERAGFDRVVRTRVGSPFVIAGMEAARAADPGAQLVGFEANGGFLLGFAARGMAPLMTRDGLLPIVAPLAAARARGLALADLVADLPSCHTAADRLQGIDRTRAAAFMAELDADPVPFFAAVGEITGVDRTDGLRVAFAGGRAVHLRPSGNAPEFRVHAQASDPTAAEALLATQMDRVAACLRSAP
ncbi:phosphomannomutase [Palleronia sp.]|uniref:phosphomannomutase n=1 Tax=Palleronia sp. TaxID=1940284 RepID=UPI0035C84A6E